MKLCSRCKKNPARSYHAYCQPCANAYMRENRPKYAQLRPDQRQKDITRSYTSVLLKQGDLERRKCCSRCQTTESIEAHHPDYDDPRRVEWLCRKCHRALHHEETAAVYERILARPEREPLPPVKNTGMTLEDVLARRLSPDRG